MLVQDFKFKSSLIYTCVMFLVCGLTVVLVCLAPVQMFIKSMLLVCLLTHGFYSIWQYALLKTPRSVTSLSWLQAGWQIEMNQQMQPLIFSPSSVVTPWICVLRFKRDKKAWASHSFIVMRDSLPAGQYSQLCALLRWG